MVLNVLVFGVARVFQDLNTEPSQEQNRLGSKILTWSYCRGSLLGELVDLLFFFNVFFSKSLQL